MNLVTPTDRANAYPAGAESEQCSFKRDTLTRAIGRTSMGADLDFWICVTGHADNFQESWYTSCSPEGPHKAVLVCGDCAISGPRTMFRGSVSGGDQMVTFDVERQDFNAAARPRSGMCAENETSRDLCCRMKRSGLFSDKRDYFTILSGGGSS